MSSDKAASQDEWACPCRVQLGRKYFEAKGMQMCDLNVISREHFARGWHELCRPLGYADVGLCSYCGNGKRKMVVYVEDKEKKIYKCDICLHLNCSILPGQPGYEESWGYKVKQVRADRYSTPPPRVGVARKDMETPPRMSPKPKRQSYGIEWKTQNTAQGSQGPGCIFILP